MVVALVVSIIGMLMLYVYLLAQRARLEELRQEVDALHIEEGI